MCKQRNWKGKILLWERERENIMQWCEYSSFGLIFYEHDYDYKDSSVNGSFFFSSAHFAEGDLIGEYSEAILRDLNWDIYIEIKLSVKMSINLIICEIQWKMMFHKTTWKWNMK